MGDPRPSTISLERTYSLRKGSPGINIATPAINIVPSDGFSSPRDTAHTPPGVVTKIDTKFYKTSANIPATAARLTCTNCGKKDNCLCKKCTLEKLKFYARKESLAKVQRQKVALAEEVEQRMGESSTIATQTNATEERIELLRRKIEEKRYTLGKKKEELRMTDHLWQRHDKMCGYIQKFFQKHQTNEQLREAKADGKRERVDEATKEVLSVRGKWSLQLFSVFPVREVLAEQPPSEPSKYDTQPKPGVMGASFSKWAVVSGSRALDEGHMFQVRDLCLSESSIEKLAAGLTSALVLPSELRPSFSAFLHTVHLVNSLATVMDYRLPYNLSLKELSLFDQWTKNHMHTQWFKLCQCVLNLGLRVGVNADSLNFHYPHSNLIEIARHICDGNLAENLLPIGVTGNHCEDIKNASSKITWGERDLQDWDIIDGEDI